MKKACAVLAGQTGSEVHDSFAGEAVDGPELKEGLAVWELDVLAVHLNENARSVGNQIMRTPETLEVCLLGLPEVDWLPEHPAGPEACDDAVDALG